MRRQSRGIQSKRGKQSSNRQRSNRRSKCLTSNESSFIFSEIPRAALLPQSSGEIAFNKIVSSKTNLFQPATSECDYLQFQQNEHFKSQRFFDDKTSEVNSSKREKFWRVLQRNNDDDSLNSSDIESSSSLQKTSKRWSKQERSHSRINQRIDLQIQALHSQLEEPTQLYNLYLEEEIVLKKKNNCSISYKQIDFRVTPKKEELIIFDNPNPFQNRDQLGYRMVHNQTAQKRMNIPQVPRKKTKIVPLHKKVKRTDREKGVVSDSNLKYFDWDQAQFLHQSPKYYRNNYFPMRNTRMSPLKFWKGQRLVYKESGKNGVWIDIEKKA